MTFWGLFIYYLTGCAAFALAIAVICLVGWGLVFGGWLLFIWAVDAFENRERR